jgi:chromosome segregation ATPase
MTTRQDVEFRLRAVDQSKRTIQETTSSVRTLTGAIKEQVEAAARGEVSTSELNETLKALGKTSDDIAKSGALILSFRQQEERLEALQVKLDAARAKEEAFRQSLVGVETVTKTQANSLARLEAATQRVTNEYNKSTGVLANMSRDLKAIGVDVRNLDVVEQGLLNTFKQSATGIATVQHALENYHRTLRETRNAAAAAAGSQDSGIDPQAIAAANAEQSRRQTARQLAEDARYVRFWTDALEEAEAAEKKLAADRALDIKATEQLSQFRALADGARQAANGYKVLETANVSLSGASSSLARDLRSIIDPASAARTTLAGLEDQAKTLDTAIGSLKGVTADYQGTARRIADVQRAAVDQGAQIDAYRRQAENLNLVRGALAEARTELDQYIRMVRNAATEDKELASTLVQARSAVDNLTGEVSRQVGQLTTLERGLERAGIDVNNLDIAERRLKTTTEALAASQARLGGITSGRGAKGVQGLFGLKPYELQNLGFQVNDVFTQLASGASITQTLAQQGGQVLQIFPGLFSKLVSYIPRLTVLGATIALIAAGTSRLKTNESAMRAFETQLKGMADGASYSAEQLVEVQRQLEQSGADFGKAGEAISVFVQKGLPQAKIEAFAVAARNLSKVNKNELAQSAEEVYTAFNRGYQSVAEFDDRLQFLTASERERIRTLFESGEADRARTVAFDAFASKAQTAADNANGPWATAWEKLGNGLSKFLDWLSRTWVIEKFGKALDILADKAGQFGDVLSEKFTEKSPLEQAQNDLAAVQSQLDQIDKTRKDIAASPGLPLGAVTAGDQPPGGGLPSRPDAGEQNQDRSALLMRRATLEKEIADLKKEQNARDFDATTIIQNQMSLTAQRASESEAQNKRADDYLDTLTRTLMANKLSTREEQIAAEAEKARLEAANQGLNDRQVQQAVDLRVTQKKKELDKEAAQVAKQAANEREAELRRQESIRKRLISQERELASARRGFSNLADNLGVTDLETRLQGIDEKFDDLIVKAKEFQRAGGTQIRGESVDQFVNDANQTREQIKQLETLKFYEDEANARIRERNDLVQTYENLVESGAMTTQEAQEKIKAVYESSGPAIQESIQAAKDLVTTLRDSGLITEEVYDRVIAKLREIVSQTQYIDPEVKKLNETIVNSFSGGVVDVFDDVAKSIAGIIQGTQTLGDLWSNLGITVAQVAAQFLKDVAMMILKLYALKLAQEITGINGGSGSTGGSGGNLLSKGFDLVASFFHGGGRAGSPTMTRPMNAGMFLNAPRYHDGTASVGLRPGEVPAILEEGEQVLSKEESLRSAFRKSSGGAGNLSLKAVLLDDKRNVAAAMATPEGEAVFLDVAKRNAPTLRSILKIGN